MPGRIVTTDKARQPVRLGSEFYARDTVLVARDLLFKRLVRVRAGTRTVARITEVEAYRGVEDRASHARWGPTKRAKIMFGQVGVAYVYLIYGMHHCLNVVAHVPDVAGAVLIRALAPLGKAPIVGPGRLTRALVIDRSQNGACLLLGDELWIEDDGARPARVVATPRIGVDYAGAWAKRPWRFVVERAPPVRTA